MTFWPRFLISRNELGKQVNIEDTSTLRLAPSTEFQGGSCCDGQIGWGPHIFKCWRLKMLSWITLNYVEFPCTSEPHIWLHINLNFTNLSFQQSMVSETWTTDHLEVVIIFLKFRQHLNRNWRIHPISIHPYFYILGVPVNWCKPLRIRWRLRSHGHRPSSLVHHESSPNT